MPRHNGYAVFSECNTYRYELGGDIGPPEPLLAASRVVKIALWLMLNPSKAGACDPPTLEESRACRPFARSDDDPTVRTSVVFSELWGFNRIMVGNVYAYIATDPNDLWKAAKGGKDIVGPNNNAHLAEMVGRARSSGGLVMAAWGVDAKLDRVKDVMAIASVGGDVHCLAVNAGGSPAHPLYRSHKLVPQVWRMPA